MGRISMNFNINLEFREWLERLFISFHENGKYIWKFYLWYWFLCSYNYNWLLDMLDNDSIMTSKASEVVQKVSADETDY